MAPRQKPTWRSKLEKDEAHKVVGIPPRMQKQWGTGTMAIARPRDVDAEIRKIRKGKLATVKQVMDRLAAHYGVDAMCPMTTGIFVRIAAEVAEEDRAAGRKRLTPYWRLLKTDGKLNEKYPGGVAAQAKRLRDEGHEIVAGRGKQPPKVVDFELSLMRW